MFFFWNKNLLQKLESFKRVSLTSSPSARRLSVNFLYNSRDKFYLLKTDYFNIKVSKLLMKLRVMGRGGLCQVCGGGVVRNGVAYCDWVVRDDMLVRNKCHGGGRCDGTWRKRGWPGDTVINNKLQVLLTYLHKIYTKN